MKPNDTLRRGLAAAVAIGVLAAPAASAAPVEELVPSTVKGKPSSQQVPEVRVVEVSTDEGFDWGDAGIGATGLLALVTIASGALVAVRQRSNARQTVT